MKNEVLLSARGLTRYFGRQQVLHDLDLDLREGEVLGFLGLNGAGKSTTMQILTGALSATAGDVAICGHSLAREPLAARRQLGYLPEDPPLYDDMRVDEYLSACARLHGLPTNAVAAGVARARARCGLADVGQRLIGHLSKGYRQRVGIAQAIVHDPRVLVLDEPTSGLDPLQIRDVRALIRELGRECAVIVSTHILPEVQLLASRIVILHHGRIVHDTPMASERGWLRVRLRMTLSPATLASVNGVLSVRDAGAGAWLLETSDAEALAADFAEHAAAGGWGLIELLPGYDELEDRFARLTTGESINETPNKSVLDFSACEKGRM